MKVKRRPLFACFFVLPAAFGCQPAADRPPEEKAAESRAFQIERELVRLSSGEPLWPGFDPAAIPLAIFDGERTYLFRHPSPPPEFRAGEKAEAGASVFEGRHEAVSANTSAEIGGVRTATLMADGFRQESLLTEIAAVAVHETFHVFQRNTHPDWAANEASLFVYPVEDAALLNLSRLETEALRRAFADPGAQICWAAQATQFRKRRFDTLDEAFVAYERGTELNEGLANYVQLKAAASPTPRIPEEGYAADAVRARAYATGSAYAMLLDAVEPEWRAGFDGRENAVLDEALAAALEKRGDRTNGCGFRADELSLAETKAQSDIAALLEGRKRARAAFDEQPGYRIEIHAADGAPLMLQGFDPLNVSRLSGDEILHTRFLRLGGGSGELEMLDQEGADVSALTVGAGPHPIFNGVKVFTTVAPEKPITDFEAEKATIAAPGFRAAFLAAEIETETRDDAIVIRLKK